LAEVSVPMSLDTKVPASSSAEVISPVTLVESTTMSTALVTALVTVGPSTDSNPEDEFVMLLTKKLYANLEGSLSLLFKSKKTLFYVLKASLLLSIESIKTMGGPDNVIALEQMLIDFE